LKNFMSDTVVETLILDLLEWVANGERSYEEVMDAWRTSCPKLPVWEDASENHRLKAVATVTDWKSCSGQRPAR
jgi:hypothetical protein